MSIPLEQLKNKLSSKRRSAAKLLRKELIDNAGKHLLEALEKEVLDKRTWETQYHMIMALGYQNYIEALTFLKSITQSNLEPMVKVALGDTITRFEISHTQNSNPPTINFAIDNNILPLCEGGIRAIAMMDDIKISNDLIDKIIYYSSIPENKSIIFWTCVACAKWKNNNAKDFLIKILSNNAVEKYTKEAAEAALQNKRLKWSIL